MGVRFRGLGFRDVGIIEAFVRFRVQGIMENQTTNYWTLKESWVYLGCGSGELDVRGFDMNMETTTVVFLFLGI